MKKRTILTFLCLIFSAINLFAEFNNESFTAWSNSIRQFSGMRNISGRVEFHLDLLDPKNKPYHLFYSMRFYSRDLRDYRLDFGAPRMLEGLTILYQYREKLLYVLNIEKGEYALQSFEDGEQIQFNPSTLLIEFLDFLISIDSTPLLKVYPEKSPQDNYIFRIQLSQPEILTLFQKEYPSINIHLDSDDTIKQIVLLNEQTSEKLNILLEDVVINSSDNVIDSYFEIPLKDYNLIEYLGSF